jgi:hypothetical protein
VIFAELEWNDQKMAVIMHGMNLRHVRIPHFVHASALGKIAVFGNSHPIGQCLFKKRMRFRLNQNACLPDQSKQTLQSMIDDVYLPNESRWSMKHCGVPR